MIQQKLKKIKKLYFNYQDIAKAFEISNASAMVSANRYVEAGVLLRLKRNLYMISEKWDILTNDQLFGIANLLQVPSYISLMTALSFYEITTQIQQDYIESIALKRTKNVTVKNTIFTYSRIKNVLYQGFRRENNIFIAIPEKAFLDALYLKQMGRYSFDLTSVDQEKFDHNMMSDLAKSYPERIQKWIEKL